MRALVAALILLGAAEAKADIRITNPGCQPRRPNVNDTLDAICIQNIGGTCVANTNHCAAFGGVSVGRCDGQVIPGTTVCCVASGFSGFSATPTAEEVKAAPPVTKMLCNTVNADAAGGPDVDALNTFLKNPLFLTTSAPVVESAGSGKFSVCAVFSN